MAKVGWRLMDAVLGPGTEERIAVSLANMHTYDSSVVGISEVHTRPSPPHFRVGILSFSIWRSDLLQKLKKRQYRDGKDSCIL